MRTVGPAPTALESRIRQVVTQIDPTLQVRDIRNLEVVMRSDQRLMRVSAIGLVTLTLSVLLLSAAGIYSLMSITVNQRRREIGIRAALGAHPRRILASVFKRAVRQLVTGVAVGITIALGMDRLLPGVLVDDHGAIIFPLVATMMLVVGLLAAYGPARRGLAIQPTEALRDV